MKYTRWQNWYCESCGAQGSVPFEEHEDVYSVVNKLDADHEKKTRENCQAGVRTLRLGRPK